MLIKDSLTLDASGLTRSRDGYLVAEARIARAFNVQEYSGEELGLKGDDAIKMFGVYRDPETVFDIDAMQSLAGRPVTRNHPADGVSAATWKDLSVGSVGGRVVRDGEHVVASLAIMDATAAAEVEAGARSLSAGYTVGVVADAGTAPDGTPYQFRQVGPLRFNHVAYLPDNNPRAGNTRIGDARHWAICPTTADTKGNDMSLQTVVLGDQAAQVAIADAPKVEAFKADMAKKLTDAETKHQTEIAAKDAAIAKVEAERDAEKAKVLDAAAIDKMVADRADLIAKVATIAKDVKTEGLTDAAIRKAVVVAKFGDAMADKPEAYIDARFDGMVEDASKGDQFADAIKGGLKTHDADPWAFLDKKGAA